MPSVMEDPYSDVKYRTSGEPPFLTHISPLPVEIVPRQVVLRDKFTTATLVPFSAPDQLPLTLLSYVCTLLNREIEAGDTYPMTELMSVDGFAKYWFGNFAAVMLVGDAQTVEELLQRPPAEELAWEKSCLGSFYVKPNYPGRSSHVCNAGFLVGPAARNKGVGRLMGEGYLEWAPKLGYSYSVFNLVYETNVASCRIWDGLGFKRIGRVKGCGNLKSYPDRLVDAIQYGRELGIEEEVFEEEDRFEKIRFYLKHGRYPDGADRSEKSRLRSAATHYRLVPADDGREEQDKLMLKDKQVISDPAKQADIARGAHEIAHAGINKTTATIAEKYHWNGIRSNVVYAIKKCEKCKEKNGENHDRIQARQVEEPQAAPGFEQTNFAPATDSGHTNMTSQTRHDAPDGHHAAGTSPAYDPNLAIDPRLTYNGHSG